MEFEAQRSSARFCSTKCRVAFNRAAKLAALDQGSQEWDESVREVPLGRTTTKEMTPGWPVSADEEWPTENVIGAW